MLPSLMDWRPTKPAPPGTHQWWSCGGTRTRSGCPIGNSIHGPARERADHRRGLPLFFSLQMSLTHIYTDGSANCRTRAGGWATVVVDASGNEIARYSGRKLDTTNNQMELHGVAQALMHILDQPPEVLQGSAFEIHSDSEYVVYGATKWLPGWKAKNWKKVKNIDYWRVIDQLLGRITCPLKISWVRGHNGDKYNELCDKIAGSEYAAAMKDLENK